jgi:hypothetical protein
MESHAQFGGRGNLGGNQITGPLGMHVQVIG